MLIGGSAKLRVNGAPFSLSSFASARSAAPGELSTSSWAFLSSAQWRSRCLCRAGVTVGVLQANDDDSNSLHLLCNCRITVSIAVSLDLTSCCNIDVGRSSPWGLRKPPSSRQVVQKYLLTVFDQLLKCY